MLLIFSYSFWIFRQKEEKTCLRNLVHLDQPLQLVLPLLVLGQRQQQLLGELDGGKVKTNWTWEWLKRTWEGNQSNHSKSPYWQQQLFGMGENNELKNFTRRSSCLWKGVAHAFETVFLRDSILKFYVAEPFGLHLKLCQICKTYRHSVDFPCFLYLPTATESACPSCHNCAMLLV